jgi:hypothetical protein
MCFKAIWNHLKHQSGRMENGNLNLTANTSKWPVYGLKIHIVKEEKWGL